MPILHLPALSTDIALLIGAALYLALIRLHLLSGQAEPPRAAAESTQLRS